ncbi:MAG: hypothetical protein JWN94_3496 [Betaproteobacteria bacterium]|nr:hypothetical protein [Betaproteobacteria bacterium]
MSPWWREEITAQLAPAAVTLTRRSRGFRRRELACETLTVVSGAAAASVAHNAVATMSAYLESNGWRNAALRVTLHGALVRYLVLPWIEKLSDRDVLVYAQQSFVDRYGETARDWAVCVNAAAQGRPHIAAATELELIETLRSGVRNLGLSLSSVQPALCSAVDDLARVDREFSGWLALIDSGHSCIARLEKGECSSVRAARFAQSPEQHLLTQLEQDALCAGIDPAAGRLYVHAASPIDHASLEAHGWLASPLPAWTLR